MTESERLTDFLADSQRVTKSAVAPFRTSAYLCLIKMTEMNTAQQAMNTRPAYHALAHLHDGPIASTTYSISHGYFMHESAVRLGLPGEGCYWFVQRTHTTDRGSRFTSCAGAFLSEAHAFPGRSC